MLATRPRRALVLLLIGLPLCAGAGPASAAAVQDPTLPGPYPVGVTRFTTSYVSTVTGNTRILTTEIWYPAGPAAAGQPTEAVFDGVRDAAHAPGRFPLLIFSHGSGGIRFQSVFYTRHLASHGFIVAAPDHPGNTLIDNTESLPLLTMDRPRDVQFLLDRLLDPASVPEIIDGHVDADRIGVTGHSFGGFTALAVATAAFNPRDDRVKAIVPLAPFASIYSAGALALVRVPVMIQGSTGDTTTPFATNQQQPYDRLAAPRYLVEITDGQHLTFASTCGASCAPAQINGYATAFFKVYLENDQRFSALLFPGAEARFSNVVFESDRGELPLPGGGKSTTDCALAAAVGPGLDDLARRSPRTVVCRDGDPCDQDPAPRSCGFDVSLCVNAVSRHAIACEPTEVAAVVVGLGDRAGFGPIVAELQASLPTAGRVCTSPHLVTVAVPSGRTRARTRTRLDAYGANGLDRDTVTLVCEAS